MLLRTLGIVGFCLGLAACGNGRPDWMEYAWEMDVDQQRWEESLPEMKVATAGLWLSRLQEKGFLTLDKPIEEMKPEAEALAGCIDAALSVSSNLSSDQVSRYSAMCVQRLGYS